MTANEKSKKIRAALKAAGISNRQVSVRHHYAGYSSAWHITIKDNSLSVRRVKDICGKFESIDRDERTGEILAGGNDFIFVERDYSAPVDGAEYLQAVRKAIAEINENGKTVPIEGTSWHVYRLDGFFNCSNKTYNKISHELGRIQVSVWGDAASRLTQALKEHAIDFSYLSGCK